MRRKSPKRQPKLSTDSLLETSKKGVVKLTEELLTEKELAKVSGGFAKVSVEYKPQKADG